MELYKLCLAGLVLIIAGCRNTITHKPELASEAQVVAKIDTQAFFNLFPVLSDDSVYLYTGYDSMQNKDFYLHGVCIPEIYSGLLSHTKSSSGHTLFNSNIDSTFALYKFDCGTHTGFLIRHPGYYDASNISLFLLNKATNKIEPVVYWLAESFGDAGDYFLMQSGIRKSDDGSYMVTIYRQQNYPVEPNSNKYMNTDSILVYNLKNENMTLLTAKEDTSWVDEQIP